jgi:hypothetical protein
MIMRANSKDLTAGGMFMAIGLFFALDSLLYLRIGKALSMGPGYFPLIMGGLLLALGALIALRAFGRPPEPFGPILWRGLALVLGSIVFFAVTVRGLGMAVALFGSVLMAAESSGLMSRRGSVILSAVLTAFSIVVFIYLLGLPYPVIGNWLRG